MRTVDAAYKNRENDMIAYQFNEEENTLKCSNGDELVMSANCYKARTEKGKKNLKVVRINRKNWKAAAAWHADKLGFFKKIDVTNLKNYDFDNLPKGEECTFLAEIMAAIKKEFWMNH